MKLILGCFIGLFAFCGLAHAQSAGAAPNRNVDELKQERFNLVKDIKIQGIHARIRAAQKMLSCVQASQDKTDIMNCESNQKIALQDIRDEQQLAWERVKNS